jgi:hypothetical protein
LLTTKHGKKLQDIPKSFIIKGLLKNKEILIVFKFSLFKKKSTSCESSSINNLPADKKLGSRAGSKPDFRAALGILVFDHTSDVIRAEKLLRSEGWDIRVMGPPPKIQTGCDLVIEFPLIEQLNICRLLDKASIEPIQVVPVTGTLLKPVDLFQTKDYGKFFMVRAANMKLTIEKQSQRIVNISGGGCPDVPYLAAEMVGKTMSESPKPLDLGHTLCGYALGLAFKEMEEQCLVW